MHYKEFQPKLFIKILLKCKANMLCSIKIIFISKYKKYFVNKTKIKKQFFT